MVDITKSNFDEHFASIETAIAEADFIALDTEFTGLLIDNENKNSLFDTCAERYTKLRESATQFTICQIGLSAFKKDPEENKNLDEKIQIEKMSIEKRRNLEECDAKERDESFLKSHLGFSRVFKLLTSHKKFYRPLPEKFEDFKNGLHELFPVIFDTKHISAKLRKPLQDSTLLKKTFLIELYNQLESTKGQQYVIHSPSIVHSEEDSRYNTDSDFIHQAGYDAYLCGYVFLRLSHIVTFQDFKSTEVAPCTFRRYLQEMGDYKNNINVIRAAYLPIHIVYIQNIADKDPKPIKPKLLFVKSLQPSYRLDAKQLAQWFSPYGAVDIKLDGSKRALVATGNYYRAGAIASGGLCLWVLFSSRKEK
ncbi:hypothetical protein KUTeg_010207 [Tegillarca granosa]|uniref:Uncharacterized protein n=1 Tax=Tegillarca granosa TaxID=220873 RepID=A0ABQ9F628_TEGGR|nr:hypothetical protein KUTeg_010207 [Tegillarca granosa]